MSLLQVNTIRNKTGAGSPTFDRGLNSTGIITLSGVRISSGVVTSSSPSGIVTYYGDGRYLTNVGSAITTIQTDVVIVGMVTVTEINSTGGGNFVGVVTSGSVETQTINLSDSITSPQYFGNGSSLSGIVTSLIAGPNISLSSSTGQITISATGGGGGVGTETDWDSNDFGSYSLSPIGIGTTVPTSILTVDGNALITGVTTSLGGFFGNLTGTATTSTNSNNTNITNDNASTSVHYPTFVSNLSGNRPQKVASSSLTFVPSTGTLGITSINCSNTITVSNLVASSVNYNGNVLITGDLDVLGDINSSSDINLKKNIKPIENSLDRISSLNGITFDWIKDNSPSMGLVAQEVEEVFPDIVQEVNGTKTIRYNSLIGALVEAIKELKQEIEELKSNK